jgi:hypothetical protein
MASWNRCDGGDRGVYDLGGVRLRLGAYVSIFYITDRHSWICTIRGQTWVDLGGVSSRSGNGTAIVVPLTMRWPLDLRVWKKGDCSMFGAIASRSGGNRIVFVGAYAKQLGARLRSGCLSRGWDNSWHSSEPELQYLLLYVSTTSQYYHRRLQTRLPERLHSITESTPVIAECFQKHELR